MSSGSKGTVVKRQCGFGLNVVSTGDKLDLGFAKMGFVVKEHEEEI